MSDGELLEHIGRLRDRWCDMEFQHHRFNGAAIVPVGDFLVHTMQWTGLPQAEILELLRGSAPVSAGAPDHLDELAAAIREDAAAQRTLGDGASAVETLDALHARSGAVGSATRAYGDLVGHRIVDGFDVANPTVLEQPDLMVTAIRTAVEGDRRRSADGGAEAHARVRDRVPQANRGQLDELLAEARSVYRLRDERGVYSDIWAAGITRRALLEAGRRLVRAGRLDRPEQLAEAGWDEVQALITGRGGPSRDELDARTAYRTTAQAHDAPDWLGAPPEPPPPLDGLPPAVARVTLAVGVFLGALFDNSEQAHEANVVHGLAASAGVYEGTARVILGPESFHRIEQGDVIVAPTTSEAFNVVLPRLGAIVSDSGGLLSHPAIVAREFGIPAVVGTRDATRLIPDGASVRVDGGAGEVRVLA